MKPHEIGFYGGLAFILGVIGAHFFNSAYIALIFSCLLVFCFYFGRRVRLGILIGCVFFFAFFYTHFYNFWATVDFPSSEATIVIDAVVVDSPQMAVDGQTFIVSLKKPYRGNVMVYGPLYPRVQAGDIVQVTGDVILPRDKKSWIHAYNFVIQRRGTSFVSVLFSFRMIIQEKITRVLPPHAAALLSGILFGERASFSKELYDALVKSGTIHIVSMSGYNVSIITASIINFFSYFCERKKAMYIAGITVLVFVIMTGAHASVVRAACMGLLVLYAELAGRIYSFRNALILTAAGMLLFNPLLITNVGFQLSFMALVGIVYGEPLLRKLFRWENKDGFFGWRKNFLQTLAAQCAVLPILIYTFGSVSIFSVVANVLIISIIPVTMFLGFGIIVFGFISYHFSLILGLITYILLSYEILVIRFFGA
ncbi:MAG: ComEC/Rec2 family competence protein [bacterium]